MPSRKVLSILILCAALVASIMIANGNPRPNGSSKISVLVENPENEVSLEGNWKDTLNSLPPETISTSSVIANESITDTFSRSFMANYLAMKQSGSLDDSSALKLMSQSQDFITEAPQNIYTTGNVVISSDNSKESIYLYGQSLGGAIKSNLPQKLGNEISLLGEMMQNKDNKVKLQIQNVGAIYKNMALSMSKIAIPSSMAENHLSLINALNTLSQNVYDISYGLDDPIRSLRGLANYKISLNQMLVAKINIKSKISKAGVVYKQGDNGYFLYFGI